MRDDGRLYLRIDENWCCSHNCLFGKRGLESGAVDIAESTRRDDTLSEGRAISPPPPFHLLVLSLFIASLKSRLPSINGCYGSLDAHGLGVGAVVYCFVEPRPLSHINLFIFISNSHLLSPPSIHHLRNNRILSQSWEKFTDLSLVPVK